MRELPMLIWTEPPAAVMFLFLSFYAYLMWRLLRR